MHDSLRHFSIFESNLDPEPFDLRISLEKLDLNIFVAAFESLDEE